MDPLSPPALAIGVLGPCATLIKFIISVLNSSKDIERLRVDTIHLQTLINDASRLVDQMGNVQYDIGSRVRDANDKIRTVQSSVDRVSGRRKVIKRQMKLPGLQKDVQDVRNRLLDVIAIAQLAATQYYFERRDTFQPEQYTVIPRVSEKIFAVAMIALVDADGHRKHRYFLYYAENARQWHSITVLLTPSKSSDPRSLPMIVSPHASDSLNRTLPQDMQTQLERILYGRKFSAATTDITMEVAETSNDRVTIDEQSVSVKAHFIEKHPELQDAVLQQLRQSSCPRFHDGEVLTRGRLTASSYLVHVDGRSYVQKRLPFVGSGSSGEDEIGAFYHGLASLHALRGCKHITRLEGIVINEQRLRAYLCEWATLGSLIWVFGKAEQRKQTIPLPIRIAWAKQLVEAVADLHRRGSVLGPLTGSAVAFRADGSVVIRYSDLVGRRWPNMRGYIAPELRAPSEGQSYSKSYNKATDMFAVGMLLWMLSAQTINKWPLWCSRTPCTSAPRWACVAEHHNPIELPPCRDGDVPHCVQRVINGCRQPNPDDRMSANQALEELTDVDTTPLELSSWCKSAPVADMAEFTISCVECGKNTTHLHYHCHTCFNGDFDICHNCYSRGVACKNAEHKFSKRIWDEHKMNIANAPV